MSTGYNDNMCALVTTMLSTCAGVSLKKQQPHSVELLTIKKQSDIFAQLSLLFFVPRNLSRKDFFLFWLFSKRPHAVNHPPARMSRSMHHTFIYSPASADMYLVYDV